MSKGKPPAPNKVMGGLKVAPQVVRVASGGGPNEPPTPPRPPQRKSA